MEISDAIKKKVKLAYQANNPTLTDEEIDSYLTKWDRFVNALPVNKRDITRLSFQELTSLIDDAIAKSELKSKTIANKQDAADYDAGFVYNQNNIIIYPANTKERCIHYGKGYSWCISRAKGDNRFNSYRYRDIEPMFYFIFDKNLPTDDPLHAIVLHVNNDGTLNITDANNEDDRLISWEKLVKMKPRLSNAKAVLVHKPAEENSKKLYNRLEEIHHAGSFSNLSYADKLAYIEFGFPIQYEDQDDLDYKLLVAYMKIQSPDEINQALLHKLKDSDLNYLLSRNFSPPSFPDLGAFITQPKRQRVILDKILSFIGNSADNAEMYVDNSKITVRIKELEDKFVELDTEKAITWYTVTRVRKVIPEFERYILSYSLHYAIEYAMSVMKSRWPKLEDAILETDDVQYITQYAYNVIGDRWPEGEPQIIHSSIDRYYWKNYTHTYFHKKRWPEFEQFARLQSNPGLLLAEYFSVIGIRAVDDEALILQSPTGWTSYATEFNVELTPNLYKLISHKIDQYEEYSNTSRNINNDVSAAEIFDRSLGRWAQAMMHYAVCVLKAKHTLPKICRLIDRYADRNSVDLQEYNTLPEAS